jgi:hypothetical protein
VAADTAERRAAENTIVALQLRNFDGTALLQYWEALRANDPETRDAIFVRLRPQLQRAIQASLAAGVLHDPEVAGPLQRPEYVLGEEQAAQTHREEAAQAKALAQRASDKANAYVSLTLMFASVLFFGGIAGTFTSVGVRNGLGSVAVMLFLATVTMLAQVSVSPP